MDTKTNHLRQVMLLVFFIIIIILAALAFFGMFIKGTDDYACAMDMLEQSQVVSQEIGRPFRPGLFAWSPYYESAGAMTQGVFFTSLTGPCGKVKVRVEFYRVPTGTAMYIVMETGRGTVLVSEGPYDCSQFRSVNR